MIANVSIVRQIAWLALIPQFLFALVLIFCWHQLRVPDPPLYGLASYLIISFLLRKLVPRSHNRGMAFIRKGMFAQAVTEFKMSYDFFDRYAWIDKYRFITILSSSAMSYKEMALTQIALSYTELDEMDSAKEFYVKLVDEFPRSEVGNAALRDMNSDQPI